MKQILQKLTYLKIKYWFFQFGIITPKIRKLKKNALDKVTCLSNHLIFGGVVCKIRINFTARKSI